MVAGMARNPIIFAMANPDPEITPEEVAEIRDDAIMATGRSDYPNQINNVLGFPYIFRGALDVRATTINEDMKVAAAQALAMLAREDVPDDVAAAYQGNRPRFGPGYIIPVPFDPRLISAVPPAGAKPAMDAGVADSYVVNGLGNATPTGREDVVLEIAREAGIEMRPGIEIINARTSPRNRAYAEFLYSRLQRKGHLLRDCQRFINNDRNYFAACAVALGDADAMVTGVTRNYAVALEVIREVIDTKPGHTAIGMSMVISRDRTVFITDSTVHSDPTAEELANIAVEAAHAARRLGYEPRVAFLANSTFGHPQSARSEVVREAVRILDGRRVNFEYDGEMAADVALDMEKMALYPFCRLKAPVNVLVTPDVHSASIGIKLLSQLGGATVLGPLLVGLEKPVQILPISGKDTDIVNMAAVAAFNPT